MEKRRITKNCRTLGRSFKNGDLLIMDRDNNNLIHVYTDEDTLFPCYLESPIDNISPDNWDKIEKSSVNLED